MQLQDERLHRADRADCMCSWSSPQRQRGCDGRETIGGEMPQVLIALAQGLRLHEALHLQQAALDAGRQRRVTASHHHFAARVSLPS